VLVAPILSVVAWWAIGVLFGEKPQQAQEGRTYPLLEKSNCRYASGLCTLENVEFKLALSYTEDDAGYFLVVRASHILQGILLAVGQSEVELSSPAAMTAVDEQGTHWRMALDSRPTTQARIRLVASASGSTWFGDDSASFLQPAVGGYPVQ
jgi:hypothetical protein